MDLNNFKSQFREYINQLDRLQLPDNLQDLTLDQIKQFKDKIDWQEVWFRYMYGDLWLDDEFLKEFKDVFQEYEELERKGLIREELKDLYRHNIL